jgi:hypothetical protein
MPRQRPASISSSQTSPHRLPNPSIDDDQREDLGDSGSSLHRTRRQPNLEGQGDETVEYAGGSYMWENCSDVELASPSGLNDDCCSDVLVRSEVPSSSPSWWALGGSSGSHGRIQVPTAKKKHTYVWQCCYCGYPSIPYRSVGCPSCGYGRCGNCHVTKVQTR